MREKANPEDQIKLYLIDKLQGLFGDDAISRVITDEKGLNLYYYGRRGMGPEEVLEAVEDALPDRVFDDGSALSSVSLQLKAMPLGHPDDDRLYRLRLNGRLTELLDNVEKNDAAGFAAAQESHRAQHILRRENRGRDTGGREGF